MELNFQTVLNQIEQDSPGAIWRIANEARPPQNYVWGSEILPEVTSSSFVATAGNMIVRSTMATPVGMDSPYRDSGMVEIRHFTEDTFKFANQVSLSEKSLRELMYFVQRIQASSQNTTTRMVEEVLNFTRKLLVQSHLDTFEWLRGQALSKGAINWDFSGLKMSIDYGIPAANKLAARTGNNRYGGTTSKFWDDVKAAKKLLKRASAVFYVNPNTFEEIMGNDVNAAVEVGGSIEEGLVSINRKAGASSTATTLEAGTTYRIFLRIVSGESEIIDPANPGKTKLKQFLEDGYMVVIANNVNQMGYRVGVGSTEIPMSAIGFTHLAPTVEGNGLPGRWAQVFTPQMEPWKLMGRAVSNGLPVIEHPEKIVICQTDMA